MGLWNSYIEKEEILEEERARQIIWEIILGLEYLHQNDVVWGDLTPQNIMFDAEMHIKLTDFSSLRLIFKQDESNFIKNSIEYMAPEAIIENQTHWSDWWSLGIIFYQMIFGELPIKESNIKETLHTITMKNIVIPEGKWSEEARDLLQKLLLKDQKERIGYIDASEIMSHSFF